MSEVWDIFLWYFLEKIQGLIYHIVPMALVQVKLAVGHVNLSKVSYIFCIWSSKKNQHKSGKEKFGYIEAWNEMFDIKGQLYKKILHQWSWNRKKSASNDRFDSSQPYL